jgi:hypothetical protein
MPKTMEFGWTETGTAVRDNDKKPIFEATCTLNDDGECRLEVGTESFTPAVSESSPGRSLLYVLNSNGIADDSGY